jgi:hypothetical protein
MDSHIDPQNGLYVQSQTTNAKDFPAVAGAHPFNTCEVFAVRFNSTWRSNKVAF